jgi:hypothetical protein
MNEIEKRISALQGDSGTLTVKIVEEIELKEATMYIFNFKCIEKKYEYISYGKTAIIIYDDGTMFDMIDWNECPETKEDIEKYEWETEDEKKAIMLFGQPRLPLV